MVKGARSEGRSSQHNHILIPLIHRQHPPPPPQHDHGVKCVAFSDDELLLCTVGIDSDKKMIVWDLSNGYIVCSNKISPQPTNCVTWGGMVKDIKRR